MSLFGVTHEGTHYLDKAQHAQVMLGTRRVCRRCAVENLEFGIGVRAVLDEHCDQGPRYWLLCVYHGSVAWDETHEEAPLW